MKIVIDIPKETYNEVCWRGLYLCPRDKENLLNAIKNGTPLPEGHGRLIDISEYEKYFNTAITYDDGNHNHTVYTNIIPTIIEAERSDSE